MTKNQAPAMKQVSFEDLFGLLSGNECSQSVILTLDDLNQMDWEAMFAEEDDDPTSFANDSEAEETVQSTPKKAPLIEWDKEAEQDLPTVQNLIIRKGKAKVFSPSAEPEPIVDRADRVKANIDAILEAKRLILANEYADTASQEILAAYSGWEGIPVQEHRHTLETHFTDEEINEFESLPQYPYAPSHIVRRAVSGILKAAGFQSGNILIHGAGNGAILRSLPKKLVKTSRVTIDATDRLSGDIQSLLFPTSEITAEDDFLQDSYYDLAITMAPSYPKGTKILRGRKGGGLELPNYAASMLRSVNAVRSGGLLLVMMDSKTVDQLWREVPFILSAIPVRLVGGLRMDYDAFGNGCCYDILVFTKARKKSALDTAQFQPSRGHIAYYEEHPECMIGEFVPEMKTPQSVEPVDESNQVKMFHAAVKGWGCDGIYQEVETDEETEDGQSLPAVPGVKNFGMVLIGGEVYQRVDSRMIKQKFTGRSLERVKGMIAIRNQARKVIQMQIAECTDEELEPEQEKLNLFYDQFVEEFGPLTKPVNLRLFREDAEASLLTSLEYTDEEDVVHKADIFTKRTIKMRKVITSCDTPQEALFVCLDHKGWVDIRYIAGLCKMDEADVLQELAGSQIFKNPAAKSEEDEWLTSDQYLSGNVLQKLEEAKATAAADPAYEPNVKALEAAQPPLIPAEDIDVTLGSPFLSPDYVSQFLFEKIGKKKTGRGPNSFLIQKKANGGYKIKTYCYIAATNPEFCSVYGTVEYNAIWLTQRLMNKYEVVATKEETDASGKIHKVRDHEKTVILLEKCRLIEDAFREWIFQDPTRETEIVSAYNQQYNNEVVPKYDGSHLTFPGMTAAIELKPHQKNAVYRIIRENGALIGHTVGSGKTITLLAAGMELKRLGRINKPLYLVPNNLLPQWGGEMMRLYPSANILLADPADMRKARRKRFLTRMALGDYDAIILGSSSFSLVPTPADSVRKTIWHNAELMRRVRFSENSRVTTADLVTPRMREDQAQNFLANQSADYNLEELGIDYLFVDESHEFKNLYCPTGGNGLRGVSNTASAKCTDLYYKTKYLASLYGGKGGFTFATGTAIVNSITELYSLQRYFQEDLLIEKNIFGLDDWLALYGNITTDWELPPEGLNENGEGFRQVRRVSSFKNVPELMKMVLQFLDTVTKDQIQMNTPDVVIQTVSCPASIEQKAYMQELVERANLIRQGRTKKNKDNMLAVTVDGRKAALDIRTVRPRAPESKTNKVNQCADRIWEFYQKYQSLRATQVAFSDISTPNQAGFNVYDALKQKLVKLGIPEDEIAFAHDFKTAKQQTSMRIKMQSGRLRVLIGSTATIGQGVNIQNRLIALHNLDVPWTPKDIDQRQGRIERPGNMHTTVFVFNYVTEGSFDSYMWQLIELKAKLISQVLRGDYSHRTIEDSDTKVLTYSEIKAIATGDTRFLQRAKLEGEIARLETLKRGFDSQRSRLKQDVHINIPHTIQYLKELIPRLEQDVSHLKSYYGDPVLECDGKSYHLNNKDEWSEAIKVLGPKVVKLEQGDILGKYNGMEIVAVRQDAVSSFFAAKDYTIALQGKATHRLDQDRIIFKGISVLKLCDEIVNGIPDSLKEKQDKLRSNELALKSAEALLSEPFEQQERLDQIKEEYAELTELLTA